MKDTFRNKGLRNQRDRSSAHEIEMTDHAELEVTYAPKKKTTEKDLSRAIICQNAAQSSHTIAAVPNSAAKDTPKSLRKQHILERKLESRQIVYLIEGQTVKKKNERR